MCVWGGGGGGGGELIQREVYDKDIKRMKRSEGG